MKRTHFHPSVLQRADELLRVHSVGHVFEVLSRSFPGQRVPSERWLRGRRSATVVARKTPSTSSSTSPTPSPAGWPWEALPAEVLADLGRADGDTPEECRLIALARLALDRPAILEGHSGAALREGRTADALLELRDFGLTEALLVVTDARSLADVAGLHASTPADYRTAARELRAAAALVEGAANGHRRVK